MPAVIAAVGAGGYGANVVSRGEWAAARAAGVPNDRITLEGIGKTTADLRAAVRAAARRPAAALARHRVSRGGRRPRGGLARHGAAAGPRPLDVLTGSTPTSARRRWRAWRSVTVARSSGWTRRRSPTAIEAGGGPDGPLRPRGLHLHVGSQLGAVDAWRDAVRKALALAALWRGTIETFDTLDVGGGFPVLPLGEPAPTAERFARDSPALLERAPGRPAADAPRHRARSRARGAVRLARGPRPPRPRPGRASGRPRCRHDRADPARPLRRGPSVDRAHVARPPGRGPPAPTSSRPASRARSASPPTPSASTTCRRCAAGISWPSPTRVRMARARAPPTTADPDRPRSCASPTAGCGSAGARAVASADG